MIWFTQTGTAFTWALSDQLPLNGAFLFGFVYNLYYIILDPIAGVSSPNVSFGFHLDNPLPSCLPTIIQTLYLPLMTAMVHYANVVAAKDHILGFTPMMAATGLFVVSWIFQFLSHGLIEKRAPALLDNLVQALVLAPFFVWIEFLFVLGYRPQLRVDLQQSVDKAIAEWKASKGSKKTK
ncbi:hypothetical protein HKX48_005297 [Thoreauomyces humboldtii]|nr:hypothetical protein HKX48_005297 [Thoreauomyces humboldtii]